MHSKTDTCVCTVLSVSVFFSAACCDSCTPSTMLTPLWHGSHQAFRPIETSPKSLHPHVNVITHLFLLGCGAVLNLWRVSVETAVGLWFAVLVAVHRRESKNSGRRHSRRVAGRDMSILCNVNPESTFDGLQRTLEEPSSSILRTPSRFHILSGKSTEERNAATLTVDMLKGT